MSQLANSNVASTPGVMSVSSYIFTNNARVVTEVFTSIVSDAPATETVPAGDSGTSAFGTTIGTDGDSSTFTFAPTSKPTSTRATPNSEDTSTSDSNTATSSSTPTQETTSAATSGSTSSLSAETTSAQTSLATTNDHKSASAAIIVGSAVGSVVALIIVTLTILIILRRRARSRRIVWNRLTNPLLTELEPSALPEVEQENHRGLVTGSEERVSLKAREAGFSTVATTTPSTTGNSQPGGTNVETQLASLQDTVTRVMERVQWLQTRAELEGSSAAEGPPPTYASK
ncbi:hypothetical protein GYMLUDRAFT_47462 [Collybiopsis luxurians FD-317 M1]|uniref:Mid2 domain-containing protein n=1 Tax=Collybiopsis luxurians FD-317 M1 TaxID=944289 RepID=A0A0D0BMD0_9AGAR|nr:hypothetical protein GYMLUDRAFT_47462 [Collybiopsis luxurians FD-317 M1]